ncbi:MAG: archaetidylserine decarboxylase [Pseudomonadota bacterium]
MATAQPSHWKSRLFVGLQYFLPQHLLTRLVRWFMSRETVWLKNLQIRTFCRLFHIRVDEAAQQVPDGYASLNAFFTRTLRDDARPTDDAPLTAPCDGVISECGRIDNGRIVQAKGFRYSAAELLQDAALADRYEGGSFMTIYLAPYDYHRVHFPVTAHVTREWHIPGQLFSVNGATASAVPRLFARNERRTFTLETGATTLSLVMVGALNVGSISTVWEREALAAGSVSEPTDLALPVTSFGQGDTLGWFNMGSTVILLLPADAGTWRDDLEAGDVVRCGEALIR